MDDTTISKSAFADELKISRARISQYIKQGMPARDDGRLDRLAALRWISEWVSGNPWKPDKGPALARKLLGLAAPVLDDIGIDVAALVREVDEMIAQDIEAGDFDPDDAPALLRELRQKLFSDFYEMDRWDRWPQRIAPVIARELGVNTQKLAELLAHHVECEIYDAGSYPAVLTKVDGRAAC